MYATRKDQIRAVSRARPGNSAPRPRIPSLPGTAEDRPPHSTARLPPHADAPRRTLTQRVRHAVEAVVEGDVVVDVGDHSCPRREHAPQSTNATDTGMSRKQKDILCLE
jgi:hypothetical protein